MLFPPLLHKQSIVLNKYRETNVLIVLIVAEYAIRIRVGGTVEGTTDMPIIGMSAVPVPKSKSI